jgi:RNA polymerase sigma-70 factor (sigma-E family)
VVGVGRTEDFTAWAQGAAHPLLRTAAALTGDRHAAEDLVQDVLARVYVAWPRVEDADAYAHRAVVNASLSRWRRLARRPEAPLGEREVLVDPARGQAAVDDRELVVHALRRLPPRQRAVLVLRYLEDRTERETADLLGVSVGAVKSQSSRALARLRLAGVVDGADARVAVEEG